MVNGKLPQNTLTVVDISELAKGWGRTLMEKTRETREKTEISRSI
jgi:hypothetical protein